MGRWVRWFGSPDTATAVVELPREKPKPAGRVMQVSIEEARQAASGSMPVSKAATPTGQMSVQQLSAEMLTAVLVQEGVLSTGDEHASLQEHRATGRPVEEIVIEQGKVSETDLVSVLSRRCKVPHLSLERMNVPPNIVELVPLEFARANRIVPLQKLGKVLNVATSNPLDVGTFKRLEEESGLRVKPMLATPRDLNECLDKYYPAPIEEKSEEPVKDDSKLTVKDFLKESWLGAVGGSDESSTSLPAIKPEEETPEGQADAGAVEEERAILLSEDDAQAFTRTSAAVLYRNWARSIGMGSDNLGPAQEMTDIEFAIAAADEPQVREASATQTKKTSSRGSRSTRKKKKRKRRSKQ